MKSEANLNLQSFKTTISTSINEKITHETHYINNYSNEKSA